MEVFACPLVKKNGSISLSILLSSTSTLYLIIITPYLPLLPFLSLIGNLFRLPLYPLLSAWLLSAGPSSALSSVTSPIRPLHHSSSPHVLLPRQKPGLIHSTPIPSLSYTFPPSLSLFPTTHSRLFLPAALSMRQVVCVYHTLISADTCSILPLTLFPLSVHTHRRGWREHMKQNAPVNNLSRYSGEPKWSLSNRQIHWNSK